MRIANPQKEVRKENKKSKETVELRECKAKWVSEKGVLEAEEELSTMASLRREM